MLLTVSESCILFDKNFSNILNCAMFSNGSAGILEGLQRTFPSGNKTLFILDKLISTKSSFALILSTFFPASSETHPNL